MAFKLSDRIKSARRRKSKDSESSDSARLLSLHDVLVTRLSRGPGTEKVETYNMTPDARLDGDEQSLVSNKSLIVNRMPLIFNDQECQVINFTDITTYKRLKQEEETNLLLKTLNATVHHEMIAPLKGNLELSMRLIRSVQSSTQKKMAQTIFVSTQLLMMHANDLLDLRIIEHGSFTPTLLQADVY